MQATLLSQPSLRRNSLGKMMLSSTALLLTTIAILIIVLALLILFHHNLNATKGYKLRSLEFVRNQLLIRQESLNTDIARAQSIESFQADSHIQAMLPTKKPTYIHADTAIAKATNLLRAEN